MWPLDLEAFVEKLEIGHRKGYVTDTELEFWKEELEKIKRSRRRLREW